MQGDYFEFYNPVKILSGKNALEQIPHEIRTMDCSRPLILTNRMLRDIGVLKLLLDAFSGSGIDTSAVFADVPQDSSVETVNDAARTYREKGCDIILAVGGGSVIDTGKGLEILISQGGEDLVNYMGAETLKRGRHEPFIAVPTTAGTGSEVTSVAVVKDRGRNLKMEFVSAHLLPDAAVLDPRLTVSLPPRITASTGMDALTHAIEAFTCIQANPLSSAYAASAISLIRENLTACVKDGRNEKRRMALANASLIAGAAFSNSMVGLVHAIGHALGGVCGVPHGDAMGILLPHCMEYNSRGAGDLYGELLLYLKGAGDYAGTPAIDRNNAAIAAVRELLAELNRLCGLPLKLSEAGVKEQDFGRVAEAAHNDGALLMNPVEADREDIIGILKLAY
jgi:alcohol dehydrogenase